MAYKNPSIKLPERPGDTKKSGISSKTSATVEYRELSPAYFMFIDVLGFKDTFESSEKQVKKVFEYFATLINQMQCLDKDSEHCYAGQTSDSLYFYTDKLEYLIGFVNVFLHFNIYAMSNNIYFRGGISKGNLHVNKPYQFYGDCVINSFKLESDIAKFPRIAVDKSTFDDIKEKDLLWSFDGEGNPEIEKRHYINPFSKIVLEEIDCYLGVVGAQYFKNDQKVLKTVGKHLKENVNKYEFSDSTYNKYIYLLNSYNSFMTGIE